MWTEQYKIEANKNYVVLPSHGKISWESPSNIALIKYWGKQGEQLPGNASLSVTLKDSATLLDTEFWVGNSGAGKFDFYFEDKPAPEFSKRVEKYLKKMEIFFPFLRDIYLKFNSRNTFPHSAGIASSASFMSALSLTLCSLENFTQMSNQPDWNFLRKASFMARLGSGSASRSVFGKMAAWGVHPYLSASSDEFAISLESLAEQLPWKMKDAVVIVDSSPKKVSSSRGHELMNGHFFAENRIQQATANMAQLLDVFKIQNWRAMAEIIENEALSLHAMMLSSIPGFLLMNQQTMDIIQRIRDFRHETNLKITFTLDAGPNVHLLYDEAEEDPVKKFIENQLKPLTDNHSIIYDQMGDGPVLKEIKTYEE